MSSAQHSVVDGREDEAPPLDADPTAFDDPVKRAEWLEHVLRCTFEMEPRDAKLVTGLVIEHFGSKDEVLDDEIPNDVRSVFYTLESKRILTFRRIEYEGEDGATLRGFYWQFHSDWEPPRDGDAEGEDGDVYDQLPEDCWNRGAAA
jgi:hypothetical protein